MLYVYACIFECVCASVCASVRVSGISRDGKCYVSPRVPRALLATQRWKTQFAIGRKIGRWAFRIPVVTAVTILDVLCRWE